MLERGRKEHVEKRPLASSAIKLNFFLDKIMIAVFCCMAEFTLFFSKNDNAKGLGNGSAGCYQSDQHQLQQTNINITYCIGIPKNTIYCIPKNATYCIRIPKSRDIFSILMFIINPSMYNTMSTSL